MLDVGCWMLDFPIVQKFVNSKGSKKKDNISINQP